MFTLQKNISGRNGWVMFSFQQIYSRVYMYMQERISPTLLVKQISH